MTARLARLALAGAFAALASVPMTAPSHADCGPVIVTACRIVCRVGSPTTDKICQVL
jgi:hypothetical protein